MKVLTVTARNRHTRDTETRRFSQKTPALTTEDAVGMMGHWLNTLGWRREEIHIMSVRNEMEDMQSAATRERLLG